MTDVEAARRELGDLVHTQTQALVETKRRLNGLSTIAVLPPELLAEIFLNYIAARQEALMDYDLHTDWQSCNSWILITQVCHYWREVALQSPSV